MTYVYMIQAGYGSVKIGVSNNPEKRLKKLQIGNHKRLHIIAKFCFNDKNEAFIFERFLHEKFQKWHMNGEWYKKCIIRKFPNRSRLFPDIFDGGKLQNYIGKKVYSIQLSEQEMSILKRPPRKHKIKHNL